MNEVTTETNKELTAPLTALAIRSQVNLIQGVMKEVMQEGQHYGVVPGCGNKPTLLKSGAEKLSLTFRLRPVMGDGDIDVVDMGNGHREYRVRCHILNMTGMELATGVGSASTMESKYRYRNIADYELTELPIPADAKENKREYRKQGFGMKKVDDVWVWVKYTDTEKSENPDIADVYNTVLKMAKKRAYVDGILSATAASDIFTQDLEDLTNTTHQEQPAAPEKHQPPQRKAGPTEQKAATTAAPPAEKKKILTGVLTKHYEPRGSSKYHSYTLDGHKDIYLQTADKLLMETLAGHAKNKDVITIEFIEWQNGTYLNRRIVGVSVQENADVGS